MPPPPFRQGQSWPAVNPRKMRPLGALRTAASAVGSNERGDRASVRSGREPILRNKETSARVSEPRSLCAVKAVGTGLSHVACPLDSAEGRDRYVHCNQ